MGITFPARTEAGEARPGRLAQEETMIGAHAAVRPAAALGKRPTGHESPAVHEHVAFVLPPLADAALESASSIGEQAPLDEVAPPRLTEVHTTNLRRAAPQRQRKIPRATAKLDTPQSATTASGRPRAVSAAPSIITARRASFRAVRGSAHERLHRVRKPRVREERPGEDPHREHHEVHE